MERAGITMPKPCRFVSSARTSVGSSQGAHGKETMATIKQQHTLDDNKIPADQSQKPLLSETYVPQTMPSILGSFDMTALFVCALFFLAYAVLGTSRGLVSLTTVVLSCVVFFVPCVIATAQLGRLFPLEGSLYAWTYQVLGSSWSLFIGLCSWLTGMLAAILAAPCCSRPNTTPGSPNHGRRGL